VVRDDPEGPAYKVQLVARRIHDSFEHKFQRQLEEAPVATIQLAAELVYIHFLVASDIGARPNSTSST
jgi:hypothetical protein